MSDTSGTPAAPVEGMPEVRILGRIADLTIGTGLPLLTVPQVDLDALRAFALRLQAEVRREREMAILVANACELAANRADQAERELRELKSEAGFQKAIVDTKLVEARDQAEHQLARAMAAVRDADEIAGADLADDEWQMALHTWRGKHAAIIADTEGGK